MTGAEIAALANALMTGAAMYGQQKKSYAQNLVDAAQTEGALKQEASKQYASGQQNQLNDVINSYRQMLLG